MTNFDIGILQKLATENSYSMATKHLNNQTAIKMSDVAVPSDDIASDSTDPGIVQSNEKRLRNSIRKEKLQTLFQKAK